MLSRTILTILTPLALMAASPMVVAQDHNAEIIQTAPEKVAESQHPASWHGKKVALRGRDVVSFSKDTGPVKGSKEYTAEWDDTKWYFSNEENRDLFKSDPKKYIPEFGGWCPVALSLGEFKVGKTNQFTRVDDKLYLNYNKKLQRQFSNNPEPYIVKAQVSW